MAEKLNKEVLGLVGIEDVMALYEKLTPWDQKDFADMFGTDFSEMDEQGILNHFGIDPIDFVDSDDVRDAFGTDIFSEYRDYEIMGEVEERLWKIDPSELLDLLDRKAEEGYNPRHAFTDEDIEHLENILNFVKVKKNNEDKK